MTTEMFLKIYALNELSSDLKLLRIWQQGGGTGNSEVLPLPCVITN